MQKPFSHFNRWTPIRRYWKQNNFTVHTLSAICDRTDESNRLNKDLSVITLELILSSPLCVGSQFIHMIKVVYTNIESKTKVNGLLSDPLILVLVCQGCLPSMLLYNIVAEVLDSLINDDKRIKGIQMGDHEIKTVNFTDNTIIFLRDITCLNRIQMILRLNKKGKLARR